ncbi:cobalamin-binding protein [Desulfomarina profundi]|uniref:Cobalamin-binding protein n=1 Tax=Desulfomarina profundi TaxID=2772557 RepID=A0A8D5JQK0_9BACT|nr:helical backbone metal receptor [Desulfomarina profundi]BCL62525.1 cobalamin-binding protein [Desulfomarina profundi]
MKPAHLQIFSRILLPAILVIVSFSTFAIAGYPRRIVSLGPINTENVYLLGAGNRLVGNTEYCIRPEAAKKLPKIGSVMQISIEKILSLHPDIVLATALTPPRQIEKLQKLHIRVVHFQQPASFSEICQQFLELGKILGLTEQAEHIIAEAKSEVRTIGRQVAPHKKTTVFLQVGTSPLFGSVEKSFTNDFIHLAGGKNILAGKSSGATSYERIISADPEVIIVAIMGSESGLAGEEMKKWFHIPILQAAEKKRIHIIDPDLVCSPSPMTFVRTLKLIATLLHPEVFPEKRPD